MGELEKLAGKYEATAKILRRVAKSLRKLTEGFGQAQALQIHPELKKRAGRQIQAKGRHSTAAPQPPKRKGMSPARRKALSEAMRVRWAEKRAAAHKPNGQHKAKPVKESVPEGNAA